MEQIRTKKDIDKTLALKGVRAVESVRRIIFVYHSLTSACLSMAASGTVCVSKNDPPGRNVLVSGSKLFMCTI